MKDLNKTIEECVAAMLDNLLNKDMSIFWPLPLVSIQPCFADLFANEIYQLIEEANEKRISNKRMAEVFEYPSRFALIIYYIITGSKQANWPIGKRLNLLGQIFEINSLTKVGNLFNLDGKNLVLSSEQVKFLSENTHWNFIDSYPKPEEISRLIGRLNGLLWIYCDCLYFVCHKAAIEKHGQYDITLKNKICKLIIRNGYALKPTDLWPGESLRIEDFPYRSIEVLNVYKDTDIKFDVFDNILNEENLVKNTFAFCIKLNVKRETEELKSMAQLQDVCHTLEEYIKHLSKKINNWGIPERAHKFIETTWYILKPLCTLLGKDWKETIPKEAFTRIKEDYLKYPPPPPPENPQQFFRKLLDPRL